MAARPKTLKSRKSVFGDLRKTFSGEKQFDASAMAAQKPVEIPVTALHIRHDGITQDQQLTFYSKSDVKFLIGNNYYHVPRCMQPADQLDLDPSIRRFTWTFKEELASKSTTPAKLESFKGAYSIWYRDPAYLKLDPVPKNITWSQIYGVFWMFKQVQDKPAPGETIEWQNIPPDMPKDLDDDWWFTGVQVPGTEAVAAATAAAGSRGPKALNQ